MPYSLVLILVLVLLCICCSKVQEPAASGKHDHEKPSPATSPELAAKPQCDKSLWDRVYNPDRLEVRDQCKTATGTIEELDHNEDGDTHMLLKLDPGQDQLLVKKNVKKKDDDLVVEVVCSGPVSDKKVNGTCDNFTNPVHIAKVGDHVRVTGTYVIDSHNGWAEIHPASNIEADN